ncbi:MAG: acyl-CoA dehydrogenase, partial [Acidimicrobiia bacterium]|nr:acyl-CoA dehydrogenase [Acidimicrobiia bacterium]
AHLREGSPGALLAGRVEAAARTAQINTFGGGVNEVQREIVAWTGLKMTRGGRR